MPDANVQLSTPGVEAISSPIHLAPAKAMRAAELLNNVHLRDLFELAPAIKRIFRDRGLGPVYTTKTMIELIRRDVGDLMVCQCCPSGHPREPWYTDERIELVLFMMAAIPDANEIEGLHAHRSENANALYWYGTQHCGSRFNCNYEGMPMEATFTGIYPPRQELASRPEANVD